VAPRLAHGSAVMRQEAFRWSGARHFLVAALVLVFVQPSLAVSQTIESFSVPTQGSTPFGITGGPDGGLWFTEQGGDKIGRIDTSGTISEFPIPTANGFPTGIVAGPDGALWFTETIGNKIGRITTGGLITKEFAIPTGGSQPAGIVSGPDGALWFTESNANQIGRVTISGGFSEYHIPTAGSQPYFITSGPDGALWFGEFNGNKIGRITTAGTVNEVPIPSSPSGPWFIVTGSDGALWFAESNAGKIGRVTTGGSITEFTIPTSSSLPEGMVAGPDGALWFTENTGNMIGHITIGGSFTEFPIPTSSPQPIGIAVGTNNALWFAEGSSNKIGTFATSTLTVVESGTGSGLVTSNVPVEGGQIHCAGGGPSCALTYMTGFPVTLTASASAGSGFAGWSGGGCSGTSTCIVTPTANTTVTATFNPLVTLTVAEIGSGAGQVTSSPSGITCSASSNQCAAPFAVGTQVTLTASASASSSFSGWNGGGCSGTSPCVVTMNAALSVTATFNPIPSFMLSVVPSGTGSGTVTSSPSGINCGATCNASYQTGTQVVLSAAAANGSTFAGWSGAGCSGDQSCSVAITANTNVTASFTANSVGNLTLVAAVLPTSRSVQLGATPTAFATIINAGPDNGSTCTIAPATGIPASFVFQTTDPTTNAVTGTANTPVNIAAGQPQSFVIAFTPTAAFPPTNVAFAFTCANAPSPAATMIGVDTLNLSASTTPVPDVVALAASGDPGFVDIPGATGTGVLAVATVNLGIDATITAAANTGAANLPVTLAICQTNPASGACLAAPAPSATTDIQPNATPTFGIFVTGSAAVANLPGVNRVFVTFTDSAGTLRGETSVAVRTQ
jgi:virginiamycin B lyase